MKKTSITLFILSISLISFSQEKGLMNTINSKHVQMNNLDMGAVHWTNGFWAERYEVFKDTMILKMWDTLSDPDIAHAFRNFEIAAGEKEGSHVGPPFHDGDFYKWFEGVAAVYANTKDPQLDKLMDEIISTISKAQREDGYIHTPVIIEERKKTHKEGAFDDRLNFETYNLGHLMTAGCVHYRATGKTTLLNMGIKAADFLDGFYRNASAELARNAICPSHYMGVVEMYRTTGDEKYLELSKNLIDIRGMVENGTDDNQDRVPFREQKTAMGHAVRANYLYAGVADVYAETGEELLKENLESIWDDIVNRKMYITGACGALYDGTSPDGTVYEPDSIQKVHQSYGRAFQLPNITAHNETCANIGNVLFNWRMLQVTGEEKYADVVETTLFNSVLSGVSLDGKRFFYTNPLRVSADFPYTLRWSKEREEYITLCNCCPPNTVRTLCEAQNYAYSVSDKGLHFHIYSGNEVKTKLPNGSEVHLSQTTDYPWDGKVIVKIDKVISKKEFSMFMRIPQWTDEVKIKINNQYVHLGTTPGSYAELSRKWKKGDVIELDIKMNPVLMESNPLVEENKNQIAVKRGPIVYCLESVDLDDNISIDDVLIPVDIEFTTKKIEIENSPVVALQGEADFIDNGDKWKNTLYHPVSKPTGKVNVRLVPYYAWGNRGKGDMTIWLPLSR